MHPNLTVTIWPASSAMPFIWAMKMAATASYRAVPSMLMVAPTGSTKRVTLLSIPRFSSRQRKVTGRVPALKRGEKGTSQGHVTHGLRQPRLTVRSFERPGGCAQSGDPGLEDAKEEGEGVFPDNNEVDAGQEDDSVDDEADDHCHHIHAQLPGYHLQVLNRDDLTADETGNTKWRVPVQMQKRQSFL